MGQALPTKDLQTTGFNGAAPHISANADRTGVMKERSSLALKYWDGAESPPDAERAETATPPEGGSMDQEVIRLLSENAELRAQLEALIRAEQSWVAQQQEYESLLEEKSEVIRTLHQKLQELESRPAAAPLIPREEELLALSDELERERCQLQQERRQLEEELMQLKEDEEALMKQMREMEVQMSRERAELARQRNELQRLNADIRHELELAQRDAMLRERLMPLQRRHQEMMTRKGSSPNTTFAQEAQTPATPQPPNSQEGRSDPGLLRRIFR